MSEPDPEVALVESMVGRTIVRARWFDPHPDYDWSGHEQCWLWLDDGRVIEFGGWGHDAWGATVDEIRLVDIDQCRACGDPHPERMAFEPGGPDRPRWYAYCTDGNRIAWEGDEPT